MKEIRVFLASSNDMAKYRKSAQQIIDELNLTFGDTFNATLKLFRWETSVVPEMGRPQAIIFQQSDFDNIDIFVGILGSRFGTPTGGFDTNNNEFESGTQEEYDRAYQLFVKTGKPHIMLFHCTVPLKPGMFDVEQYNKVQRFLGEFNANKANPGLYKEFNNQKSFETAFRISLTKAFLKEVSSLNDGSTTNLSSRYKSEGFLRLFIPVTNKMRSIEKIKAIEESSIVWLIAKTGNSFLGTVGNRYLDGLIDNLSRGGSVKILLQNPWCTSAIVSAFAESGRIDLYKSILQHSLPSQAIIEAYEKSEWFNLKLMDVINGYREIQKQYPEIKLRFTDSEITASVLLTDKNLFFEPYVNYLSRSRLKKNASTFEIEMTDRASMYENAKQYFDVLWESAITYEALMENKPRLINYLANSIDAVYVNNTTYYVGIHVLIRNGSNFLLLKRTDTKAYMPGMWDIPGGSMEAGETIIKTAEREVYEETGLKVNPTSILYGFMNPVELPARQTIQIIIDAEYSGGEIKLNPQEHSDWKWICKEDALQLPLINFLYEYLLEHR